MALLLNEAAAATAANPRVSREFEVLKRNQQDQLVVIAWDSYCAMIEKPTDASEMRLLFSTKIKETAFTRLEGVDMEGRPVFFLSLCMSCSPKGCDESCSAYQLRLETRAGTTGGFESVLVGGGIPGFCIVHVFDKGEKQTIPYPLFFALLYSTVYSAH